MSIELQGLTLQSYKSSFVTSSGIVMLVDSLDHAGQGSTLVLHFCQSCHQFRFQRSKEKNIRGDSLATWREVEQGGFVRGS